MSEHRTKANQRKHAMKRAQQRFGVSLSRKEFNDVVDQITSTKGTAVHVYKHSNRLSVFRVNLKGKDVHAAYDKNHHVIATFFPIEWDVTTVFRKPSSTPTQHWEP